TGEQFRYLWQVAGGEALTFPLQVAGGLRTVADVRARDRALADWWAEHEDARVFSAVRRLRRPRAWVASTAFGSDGRPHRGLLAVGEHRSTRVFQEAVRVRPGGPWSRECGGACTVEDGRAGDLAAVLVRALPDFSAGGAGPLRADVADIEARSTPIGDGV